MEGAHMIPERRDMPGGDYYNFFHAPEYYIPMHGEESLEELRARAESFLDELRKKADEDEWKDRQILVATHGAASRALLAVIRHTPKADFWGDGVPKNCAVSIAELRNGAWVILEQDRIYYSEDAQ
jgi:probable phosphoglycerate mutase